MYTQNSTTAINRQRKYVIRQVNEYTLEHSNSALQIVGLTVLFPVDILYLPKLTS